MKAWSHLMQEQLLDHPVLAGIAQTYNKSAAQTILRWDLQHGIITIPKSTKEQRMKENASVFDFELTQDDMNRIDALNENLRVGPDPNNFDF